LTCSACSAARALCSATAPSTSCAPPHPTRPTPPPQAIKGTELQRVFLRNTGISGELTCDLMIDSLTHLSLATNNIDGTIPDCMTQAPNIEDLYLSRRGALRRRCRCVRAAPCALRAAAAAAPGRQPPA
jgi:hypothetical protein